MGLVLAVLILWLLLGGVGFAVAGLHLLLVVALVVAVIWALGWAVHGGAGYGRGWYGRRWGPGPY